MQTFAFLDDLLRTLRTSNRNIYFLPLFVLIDTILQKNDNNNNKHQATESWSVFKGVAFRVLYMARRNNSPLAPGGRGK